MKNSLVLRDSAVIPIKHLDQLSVEHEYFCTFYCNTCTDHAPHIHIRRVNLIELPLMTVSLCKCPPCHLGPHWPTLSFYLHVANSLNCATGLFIVPKPAKPFLSKDNVKVINLKSSQQLLIPAFPILIIWILSTNIYCGYGECAIEAVLTCTHNLCF